METYLAYYYTNCGGERVYIINAEGESTVALIGYNIVGRQPDVIEFLDTKTEGVVSVLGVQEF